MARFKSFLVKLKQFFKRYNDKRQNYVRKMIKIECGFPPSYCIGCVVCGGTGYILVDDEVDIEIGDMSKCGKNPAWLHYIPDSSFNYVKPTIYFFIPSSHFTDGKVKVELGGVKQWTNLEDIIFDSLEHETIHHLIAKMLNMFLSQKLDNIHKEMIHNEW
jgi:hypothetical protein